MSGKVIHLIAGARPNFMKIGPLWHTLSAADWARPVLVHTGQHYDENMSGTFLRDLGLPQPDHFLGVGGGSHAEQTARIMIGYERLALAARPDWVVVVGDVDSTLACAITAKKLRLPLAHLEAGLRSRDRTMPEEINRLATDSISDLLWAPSADGVENLRAEGHPEAAVEMVGNIMIDALVLQADAIRRAGLPATLGLTPGGYAVMTLHRPANVDDAAVLGGLVAQLEGVAARLPIVFPVHPRTRQRLVAFGLLERLEAMPGITLLEPLGYIQFMSLVHECRLVITDSGGVQEESTYLRIPCLTVRESTERPVTVTVGTNRLLAAAEVAAAVERVLAGDWPPGRVPDLWDGRTAGRVVDSLRRRCGP